MEYKINFSTQVRPAVFLIFAFVCLIAMQIYHSFYSGNTYINWPIFIVFMVTILPAIYLHIEYHQCNKRVKLKIDKMDKALEYVYNNGEVEKIYFEDIKKITVYMAPSWHRKSYIRYFPIEYYHYARIYTKSKKEIIITCLMAWPVEDVMRTIEGVPIELKKRILASVLIG